MRPNIGVWGDVLINNYQLRIRNWGEGRDRIRTHTEIRVVSRRFRFLAPESIYRYRDGDPLFDISLGWDADFF